MNGLRWCVQHRGGWCATSAKRAPRDGADSVKTACGMHVVLPFAIDWRKPTCKYCKQGKKDPETARNGAVKHSWKRVEGHNPAEADSVESACERCHLGRCWSVRAWQATRRAGGDSGIRVTYGWSYYTRDRNGALQEVKPAVGTKFPRCVPGVWKPVWGALV